MKVVRLKRGYRIHLSDAEAEVLHHMHILAGKDIASDPDRATSVLSPAAKAAVRHGRIGHALAFTVDEDRRSE